MLRATSLTNAAITGGNTPFVVSRSALQLCKTPSGTMGNNGAFTAGTAYGRTLAKCYLYFAVNQIAAGVAAGWYYAEGSSTTAFIVYNNTYTTGTPMPPTSKTAFVTTGPGATTGDITEQGVSITMPNLGPTGYYRVRLLGECNNTAGTKTFRIRLGGSGGTAFIAGAFGSGATRFTTEIEIANQGSTSVQIGDIGSNTSSAFTADTASIVTGAIDTTATPVMFLSAQNAVATDWASVTRFVIEAMTDGT